MIIMYLTQKDGKIPQKQNSIIIDLNIAGRTP